jgi:hypothetical protein
VALFLAACSRKDIQTPEAVRQAVMDDLQARQAKTGVDLSTLKVEVPSVTFNRDEARATVSFLPKGGGGMQMPYTLTRKGDKWVVTERGVAHADALPAGSSNQPLPPGHPSFGAVPGQAPGQTTDGQTQLPAGHPPVQSKQ